ncbi:class I SAM-dependent methyltransferase [Actinomycetospora cinnamomea]|uniref:class I SAM-dependent methyltransferase n=1 Tax=Actinomycetospora cinnamomea TaxID=663609 RepID=UPI000E30F377
MNKIPGWLPGLDQDLFNLILGSQDRGDLTELGAYMGQSAVVIGAHCRQGERFLVIDLFGSDADDPANALENANEYRSLNRQSFERYYRRVHRRLPEVVQGRSDLLPCHVTPGSQRFVHVDASHLFKQVVVDIKNAHTSLMDDGVLVLDDYRSMHTPGVSAAAWSAVGAGLRPFALTPQKMYATWGDASRYGSLVENWAALHGQPFERQAIYGESVVRLKPRPGRGPTRIIRRRVRSTLSAVTGRRGQGD